MSGAVNEPLTPDGLDQTAMLVAVRGELAEARSELAELRAQMDEVQGFVRQLVPLVESFGGLAEKMAKGGPAAFLGLLAGRTGT